MEDSGTEDIDYVEGPRRVDIDAVLSTLEDVTALEKFGSIYREMLPSAGPAHPSFAVIPRLFTPKVEEDNLAAAQRARDPVRVELHTAIRKVARDVHHERKSRDINSDLDVHFMQLCDLIRESSRAYGSADDALWVTYGTIKRCRALMRTASPLIADLLRPSTILRLHRNERGEVSGQTLLDLVNRQIRIKQIWHNLLEYDSEGKGDLSESDLHNYIRDRIPLLAHLEPISIDFHETYAVYASRKFFFFLDRHRTNRIKIRDVLRSEVLVEFDQLEAEDLEEADIEHNWFSVPFISKVHNDWIFLDQDKSGLLSPAELAKFGADRSYGLTEPIIQRIFQCCPTYGGEIDYKVYLDLRLAMLNPKCPESVRFFARLLDFDDLGVITRDNVGHFWNGVTAHPLMAAIAPDLPSAENIVNEIFDMVNPKADGYITISELVRSGVGHTVCSILIDTEGFHAYENRESIEGGP